jgi:S1-C subfamily serine protease
VAGESTTILERADGSRVTGTVVAFDPERDVAIVRAPSIDRPSLPLASAQVNAEGAVYGHPGGGPLVISPFRVGQRIVAVGTDIYDRSHTRRDVLVIASKLAPGDSGSALITPKGVVIGLAFAIAPDRPGVAYALEIDEIEPVVQSAGAQPVSTGACVS